MDDSGANGMASVPHLSTILNSNHGERDGSYPRDLIETTDSYLDQSTITRPSRPEPETTASGNEGGDTAFALDSINSGAIETNQPKVNQKPVAEVETPLLKAEQEEESLLDSRFPPPNPRDIAAQAANVAQLASNMGMQDLSDYGILTDQETQELASVALSQASFGDQGVPPFALEGNSSLPMPSGSSVHDDAQYFDGTSSLGESEAPRIQAFAKLEFDDGQFYMNTYAVELGRDIRATRVTSRTEPFGRHGRPSSGAGSISENVKRDMGGSIISERGGIMGLDSQSVDEPRKRKRGTKGSKKSKSTSSSSQLLSKRDSGHLPSTPFDYQSLAMSSLQHTTAGAHPVDPISLLPSPDECPLIPIHPPALVPGAGTSQKSISRKHARIAYNFEKHLFEVEITGRNGAFVDEQWYPCSEVRPLKSGSNIQLGGVSIKFVLPDVAIGETGAEGTYANGGKGPAYALGPARAQSMEMEDSDEADDDEDEDAGDFSQMETVDVDDEDEEEVQITPPPQPVPIKRGPGRPPKNGIMSKRQQRELEKAAKLKALEQNTPYPSTKGKVGRPEKLHESDPTQSKPEKRKYTKRKTLESQDLPSLAQENIESSVEARPAKEKKLPRPPRPPRSPSPVFDESKLTAADLAKPQVNYVVIIHDALSNSSTGTMSLPQIYRAIERKYPYFKLRVQTQGWQSSVRHNLSQNAAFQKVQRDGKGWMWGVVPGVSIEKEKRRRASPPQMPSHLQHQQPMAPQSHPALQQHRASMAATHPHASNAIGMTNGSSQSNIANSNALNATSYQSPYAPPPPSFNQPISNGNAHPLTQAQQPIAQRPTPPPSRPRAQRTVPDTDILFAVSSYKVTLLNSLSNSPRAEALITSAINRALGLSDKSTATPEGQPEDPQERTFINGITSMLDQIKKRKAAAAKEGKKAEAQRVLSQAISQGGGASESSNGMTTRSSQHHTGSSLPSTQQSKANGNDSNAQTPASSSTSPALNGTRVAATGTKRPLEMLDPFQETDSDGPDPKKLALSPAVDVGAE
jgi:hypothetical protein